MIDTSNIICLLKKKEKKTLPVLLPPQSTVFIDTYFKKCQFYPTCSKPNIRKILGCSLSLTLHTISEQILLTLSSNIYTNCVQFYYF